MAFRTKGCSPGLMQGGTLMSDHDRPLVVDGPHLLQVGHMVVVSGKKERGYGQHRLVKQKPHSGQTSENIAYPEADVLLVFRQVVHHIIVSRSHYEHGALCFGYGTVYTNLRLRFSHFVFSPFFLFPHLVEIAAFPLYQTTLQA